MPGGAFVIGPAEVSAIRQLREHAAANPIRVTPDMRGTAIKLPDEMTIDIAIGYRVTYTVDLQPLGACRHLAVSHDGGGPPHTVAVTMLMGLFGFINPFERCIVYRLPDRVLNVVEPVDGNFERWKRESA